MRHNGFISKAGQAGLWRRLLCAIKNPPTGATPKINFSPIRLVSPARPGILTPRRRIFCAWRPETVGVHGRMLHLPDYTHKLEQRKQNFHLLEEFVECMANNGADVCAQVGSNWVHACGLGVEGVRGYCEKLSDAYQTPFHMAGYAMVEALRALNIEKVAVNGVYHRPSWWRARWDFCGKPGSTCYGRAISLTRVLFQPRRNATRRFGVLTVNWPRSQWRTWRPRPPTPTPTLPAVCAIFAARETALPGVLFPLRLNWKPCWASPWSATTTRSTGAFSKPSGWRRRAGRGGCCLRLPDAATGGKNSRIVGGAAFDFDRF